MSGELWRSQFQIGKEVSAGTAVAATRKMYFNVDDSVLTREREPRPHRFATGTRDNVRAYTQGPQVAGGRLSCPLSASELIELFLIGLKGSVSPSNPSAGVDLWTFVPGSTALDAATLEWYDGGRGWRAVGAHVNSFNFRGSANGEHMVAMELLARSVELNTITESLVDRVPDFIEGWETKVYIDSHEGTAGNTVKSNLLINWDVTIDNQLGRKYWANNTNALGDVIVGEIAVTARLLLEGAAAQSATEFASWDAETLRLIRLEFGQNDVISGGYKKFVTIDLPGAWSALDLGQIDAGTRAYELELQYVFDPTNQYGVQVRCQNARSAAWDNGS